MGILKKPVSILLSVMMVISVFSLVPFKVSAADAAAYYKDENGHVEYFSNVWEAWNKAEQNNATFGLLDDWVSNGCRSIRDYHNVTVELNGYIISRGKGMTDWQNNGEVINVGENAVLSVYGGTKENPAQRCDAAHILHAYLIENNALNYKQIFFKGGAIHGGNSSNGAGGIHMKEKSRVNLYYTTVAGCRSEQTVFLDGYGGGVMMAGKNCRLYMDHSTISYNYAYNYGGGIYVNNTRCSIKMVQSHIDYNISRKNGGGIYADDEYFRLEGDAVQQKNPEEIDNWDDESLGSTVSHNYIIDSNSNGGGGGLYLRNIKCIVNGINFCFNEADKDGNGGGIYVCNKNTNIKNCNIAQNCADKLGGGVKIDNSDITIQNCTIYGNSARDTGGAGGGVYVCSTCNLIAIQKINSIFHMS